MSDSEKLYESDEVIHLINSVRDGDQSAFQKLADAYSPLIDSLVVKFYNGDVFALNRDDLRQEAVLRFYNSIMTYDTDQAEVEFGLYAKICISNALVSQIRLHKKHTAEQLTESPNFLSFVHDSEDPSDRVLEEERIKALYALVRKNLSVYEYRVWRLYMSGGTAKDISTVVGADEKSVSNAIYRIRKKLKALLL
ncbi:MAG: sigma-70 family RNA polymerase sigma factor [Clostridia bacterium]|nr:sigma-70 family RNA polymerase sigma factor [Clostridia bacterium]